MSVVTWQSGPFITDVSPGVSPDVVLNIPNTIDATGEDSAILQAEVVGGGSILCDVYIWNGVKYINTLTDILLDSAYPTTFIPGGLVYAIYVYSTVGVVTSWSIKYGLESQR